MMQAAAKGKGKKKATAMLSEDEDSVDEDSASEGDWAPKVMSHHLWSSLMTLMSFQRYLICDWLRA